ncbi:MAG: hypothetical protein R3190_08865 [Thermoanaerobaculia bacterium]|nr:hypothetical protein [Thermoanaerobaculia bacterium]
MARLAVGGRPRLDQIRRFQLQRLREIVRHAQREVPVYRRLWAGLPPAALDFADIGDLRRLPPVDKGALREAGREGTIATSFRNRRLEPTLTSGVSGSSLLLFRTPLECRLLEAFRLRTYFGYGGRWRDLRAVVAWTGRRDTWESEAESHTPLWHRLGILPRVVLDCQRSADELAAEIRGLRPQVLGGYPTSLARVADLWTPVDRERSNIRLVLTGGESLTPPLRRRIAAGIGARVFDCYGASELNLLAWECPETGLYHVVDDALVLEVERDGRPAAEGEEGDVLVTGLHSFAMPFVRFRLGDRAVRGPDRCPCGAPWSTLAALHGRAMGYLRLPGGRDLHYWGAVSPLMAVAPWALEYRLLQRAPADLLFQIVAERPPTEAEAAELHREAARIFGDEVRFEHELVERLPLGPGGKHVSFVPLEASARN